MQSHCPEAKAPSVCQTTGRLPLPAAWWGRRTTGKMSGAATAAACAPWSAVWSHQNIREAVDEPLDRCQPEVGRSIFFLSLDHNSPICPSFFPPSLGFASLLLSAILLPSPFSDLVRSLYRRHLPAPANAARADNNTFTRRCLQWLFLDEARLAT